VHRCGVQPRKIHCRSSTVITVNRRHVDWRRRGRRCCTTPFICSPSRSQSCHAPVTCARLRCPAPSRVRGRTAAASATTSERYFVIRIPRDDLEEIQWRREGVGRRGYPPRAALCRGRHLKGQKYGILKFGRFWRIGVYIAGRIQRVH